MGIKYGQMARATWDMLQQPFEPMASGRFIDAVADSWLMDQLYSRMTAGLPPDAVERLRRLTRTELDEAALLALPENTFGHGYARHQRRNGYDLNGNLPGTPAVRAAIERNWVLHRFGRLHDMMHYLLGFGTDSPGEAGLQLFNFLNFREPYGALAMASLPIILYQHGQPRQTLSELRRAWRLGRQARNLLMTPLEEMLPLDLGEVRRTLGIHLEAR